MHLGAEPERRIAGREGLLHRLREVGLLVLRPRGRPGRAQYRAGDLQNPALVDARPQHVGRRAHVFREVDVEPGDRGLQLGTRLGLEGELALHRPRDAGGEQRLLPGLRKFTERRKGLAVVLDREPVEAETRAVFQHRLARAPGGEVFVVHAHGRPVGGLADRDVERVRLVAVGEDGAAELEQHEVEGGLEVPGELRLHQSGADRPEIVGKADADAGLLARLGLAVLRQGHGPGHRRSGDAAGIGAGASLGGIGGAPPSPAPVWASPDSPAGVSFGMSSGRTSPSMTWSVPSRAMVAMQPAIPKSSRL